MTADESLLHERARAFWLDYKWEHPPLEIGYRYVIPEAMAGFARVEIGGLLSVIHRDGGHHVVAHGLDESRRLACELILSERTQADAAQHWLTEHGARALRCVKSVLSRYDEPPSQLIDCARELEWIVDALAPRE